MEIEEGFKDLLLLAASTAMERRKPNPEALLVAGIIASGNFEQLNSDLLLKVFHDAGLYCHRTVIDLTNYE